MKNRPTTSNKPAGIKSLNLFSGQEHQPFYWPGGHAAALFIHGFMGTPEEMRPAAQALQQDGWTTKGLLLPGFGAQIDTLFQRSRLEWVDAARSALLDLKMEHDPTIVVGYSMGAAVALLAAADVKVDAVIVLAPFLRIGTAVHRAVFQLVKVLFPNPQPFKRVNFQNQRLQDFFNSIIPEIDLQDDLTQQVLRDLHIPARFAEEVFAVGRDAEKSLGTIDTPIYILQGTKDEAIPTWRTRKSLPQFGSKIIYHELESDHQMLNEGNLAFPEVAQTLRQFGRRILRSQNLVGSL